MRIRAPFSFPATDRERREYQPDHPSRGSSMRAFRILLLVFVCQASLAQSPQSPIPANDEIRKVVAERLTIKGAGMVVGIIEPEGRRVVAVGESHSADGRPLDGDTIFQIGSVTKTFTTLLLADAVRRGEVALDDPAAKYLPRGVTLPERGRPITLRDLATHVSGLPSMPSNLDLRANPDPIAGYTPRDFHEFLSNYQ